MRGKQAQQASSHTKLLAVPYMCTQPQQAQLAVAVAYIYATAICTHIQLAVVVAYIWLQQAQLAVAYMAQQAQEAQLAVAACLHSKNSFLCLL